jgi:hypothetical protein
LWFHPLLIISLQHQAARIVDIDFGQPVFGRETKEKKQKKRKVTEELSEEEQSAFLSVVKTLAPNAAILTSCFEQIRMPSVPTRRLPCTFASLYDPKYKDMDQQQLASECKEVFKNMKIDQVGAMSVHKFTSRVLGLA